MKELYKYLDSNREIIGGFARNARVFCNDGFSVSIQAGSSLYCEPRENLQSMADYLSYELGFPSTEDDLITPYAEDVDDLTNTVYARVPKEVVEQLINKHNGVKEDNLGK